MIETSSRGEVSIQKTGKGIKLQTAFWTLLLVVSLGWLVVAFEVDPSTSGWPLLLSAVSVLMLVVCKIRQWWHHD